MRIANFLIHVYLQIFYKETEYISWRTVFPRFFETSSRSKQAHKQVLSYNGFTMAHPENVVAKTISAVQKARNEVNSFKTHFAQLIQATAPPEQAMAGSTLKKHIAQAEALVEKAESTVKRVKAVGRVPPRPTDSVPASVRAKRALSVLLAGVDGVDEGSVTVDEGGRNVRRKSSEFGTFLSAAGKPMASPIREDDLNAILMRVSKETNLIVGRAAARGVGFECRNIFRAFVWFKEVPHAKGSASGVYIVPEHIGCFSVDELSASRWSCSEHAVFNVLTERANAAIRYFMGREDTGEEAFVSLVHWLSRHKTLFSAKSDNRRLAFDASRGMFLPPCVYSFGGKGNARFTRGSIPVRSGSAQPTVRVHSSSQSHSLQQHAAVPSAPCSLPLLRPFNETRSRPS